MHPGKGKIACAVAAAALLALQGCNPMTVGTGSTVKTTAPGAKGIVATSAVDVLDASYRSLAAYWAPQFYQDTAAGDYKGDLLIKFNYDGDYQGNNNWEDLDNYSMGDPALTGNVYYSVVESQNFWFIGYYTYHARDWDDINTALNSHENDLEGTLLAVKKTGGNGTLVCVITFAHNNFYQYNAPGQSLTSGSDNVDGQVLVNGSHPEIFIESKGHGVFAYDGSGAPGGDGIVYDCNLSNPQSPTNATGNYTNHYGYNLIAMDASTGDQGFWYRRNNIGANDTFASWGVLAGDTYGANQAKMPWIWDDADDGEVYSGDMLADPANLIDVQLSGTALAGMSHNYVSNIFATHMFQIIGVCSNKNRDPFGGASDIYVRVTAAGAAEGTSNVLDDRQWKKNNAPVGTWFTYWYGGYDATGQKTYSETVNTHYFCRQGSPSVTFAVYDSDDPTTATDDFMGSVSLTNTTDYSAGVNLGDASIKFTFAKLQ